MAYDSTGNITQRTTTLGSNQFRECFKYDAYQRLTRVYTTGVTDPASCSTDSGTPAGNLPYEQDFTHSADGNLLTRDDGSGPVSYTYPTGGASSVRPHAPTTVGSNSYTWNANGDLATRTVSGTSTTFNWDTEHNLASTTSSAGNTTNVYDANGQRLLRTTPAGTTLYLDGQEVTATPGGSPTVTATRLYTFAGQLVATRSTSGGVDYLVTDHQGTVEAKIDAGSSVVSALRAYKPYGQPRTTDTFATQRGWIGQVEDPATSLSYLNARYYDPTISRFITPDPLYTPGQPKSLNPYTYAWGNPTTATDPSGLITECGCDSREGPRDPYIPPPGPGRGGGSGGGGGNGAGSGGGSGSGGSGAGSGSHSQGANSGSKLGSLINSAVADTVEFDPVLGQCVKNCYLLMRQAGEEGEHCASGVDGAIYQVLTGNCDQQKKYDELIAKALDRLFDEKVDQWIHAPDHPSMANSPLIDPYGGACSFDPDTRVLMGDGTSKPISEIRIGDSVWSTNPKTGKSGPQKVIATYRHNDDNIVSVFFKDGSRLTTTTDHPFWNKKLKKWEASSALGDGDLLLGATGESVAVKGLSSISKNRLRVYNLEVNETHAYYVGVGRDHFVLAHNIGCDEFAEALQRRIGGDIYRIDPPDGVPYLGEYELGPSDELWSYHTVLVKEGRVYDQFTPSEGVDIDTWKGLWRYQEDLDFGF
jgi:RHS repeat-associated protein